MSKTHSIIDYHCIYSLELRNMFCFVQRVKSSMKNTVKLCLLRCLDVICCCIKLILCSHRKRLNYVIYLYVSFLQS